MVDGKPLTEIINQTQVNVKYLPNASFTKNVVAVPDITEAKGGDGSFACRTSSSSR